jgi:hypothetical protein
MPVTCNDVGSEDEIFVLVGRANTLRMMRLAVMSRHVMGIERLGLKDFMALL